MFPDRRVLGPKILEVLAKEPMPRREIAKAIGRSPFFVDDALKLLPQVKKVSSFYGLSEEAIYAKLARRGGNSKSQRKAVSAWLEKEFLTILEQRGSYQTQNFAADCGLDHNALAHFIHDLSTRGLIRRVAKGTWTLASPMDQTRLL
jgi:DNA-binding transcriptional ArsR family regulator